MHFQAAVLHGAHQCFREGSAAEGRHCALRCMVRALDASAGMLNATALEVLTLQLSFSLKRANAVLYVGQISKSMQCENKADSNQQACHHDESGSNASASLLCFRLLTISASQTVLESQHGKPQPNVYAIPAEIFQGNGWEAGSSGGCGASVHEYTLVALGGVQIRTVVTKMEVLISIAFTKAA